MELDVIVPKNKFEGAASTTNVEKIGKKILETKVSRFQDRDFVSRKEATETENYLKGLGFDTTKEDLTFDNNTALYTTVVADFIERKVRPTLVAEGLIKSSRVEARGTTAVKIPISKLATAQALPDSGDVSYNSSVDYDNATVTLGWIYSAQKITYELITQSNVDIIQDQLYELGDAISRKIDSDILAAFETATPDSDANANYAALGTSTTITYDTLVEHITEAMDNNVMPNAVVMGPGSLKNILQDTDVKSALGFNSVQQGTVFPMVMNLFGLKVLVSQQVSADTIFLVDTERCGYFLEGSSVEVFDGRVSGSTAQEVIAVKLYGVTVAQPESVYRILENTAE